MACAACYSGSHTHFAELPLPFVQRHSGFTVSWLFLSLSLGHPQVSALVHCCHFCEQTANICQTHFAELPLQFVPRNSGFTFSWVFCKSLLLRSFCGSDVLSCRLWLVAAICISTSGLGRWGAHGRGNFHGSNVTAVAAVDVLCLLLQIYSLLWGLSVSDHDL